MSLCTCGNALRSFFSFLPFYKLQNLRRTKDLLFMTESEREWVYSLLERDRWPRWKIGEWQLASPSGACCRLFSLSGISRGWNSVTFSPPVDTTRPRKEMFGFVNECIYCIVWLSKGGLLVITVLPLHTWWGKVKREEVLCRRRFRLMKGSHGENREPLWEDAVENCVQLFLIINSRRDSIVRFASSSKHLWDSDLIWLCHSQFITTSNYSFSGLTKKKKKNRSFCMLFKTPFCVSSPQPSRGGCLWAHYGLVAA